MFAHQSLVENLVDFIIRRPVVANDVICDCLNEFRLEVIVHTFLLDVWVGECCQTFSVIDFHVGIVGAQHIKRDQIDHALFPCQRSWVLKVLHSFDIVVFDFVERILVRTVALPDQVGHRLKLQED